jgi:hypothetical protein
MRRISCHFLPHTIHPYGPLPRLSSPAMLSISLIFFLVLAARHFCPRTSSPSDDPGFCFWSTNAFSADTFYAHTNKPLVWLLCRLRVLVIRICVFNESEFHFKFPRGGAWPQPGVSQSVVIYYSRSDAHGPYKGNRANFKQWPVQVNVDVDMQALVFSIGPSTTANCCHSPLHWTTEGATVCLQLAVRPCGSSAIRTVGQAVCYGTLGCMDANLIQMALTRSLLT